MTKFKPLEDADFERFTLAGWLHETYFDDEKKTYFTETDIENLGSLLQWMMQYRPSSRPQTSELLGHIWFQENPSGIVKFAATDS